MSPAATEGLAHHYQVMASLTPEQRMAINRRDLARSQGNFNGRTERENLAELFERIAASPDGQ